MINVIYIIIINIIKSNIIYIYIYNSMAHLLLISFGVIGSFEISFFNTTLIFHAYNINKYLYT